MGRKILFVTTDQQRYDTLGCNGGTLAAHAGRSTRSPPSGVRYERAHPAVGRVHAVALDDRSPASTRARTASG